VRSTCGFVGRVVQLLILADFKVDEVGTLQQADLDREDVLCVVHLIGARGQPSTRHPIPILHPSIHLPLSACPPKAPAFPASTYLLVLQEVEQRQGQLRVERLGEGRDKVHGFCNANLKNFYFSFGWRNRSQLGSMR